MLHRPTKQLGLAVRVTVMEGDQVVASGTGRPDQQFTLTVPGVERWSPDNPRCYDVHVALLPSSEPYSPDEQR